jgi:hypothetical protein
VIGFVYILTNPYFASNVYKVGCTERAPHARAEELSKGTAIPAPFEVLCFIEIDGFQQVEKQLHAHLEHFRINTNREFFEGGLEHALAWMWWNKASLGFHGVASAKPFVASDFFDYLIQMDIVSPPNGDRDTWSMHSLPNPWEKEQAAPPAGPDDENQFDAIEGDLPWEKPSAELKMVGGTDL